MIAVSRARPTIDEWESGRSPASVSARTAIHALTGCSFPFATTGSVGWYSITPLVSRYVSSPTTMPLMGAADCRRDAVLTTSPASIDSPREGRAPSDTTASPVLTAIRTCRSPPASSPALSRTTSAARTARSASSPCANGAPKMPITASPMNFSTIPPNDPISRLTRSW